MKKILVIEDDNALRKNISVFLSEEGYEVVQASDGMQGIQYALDVIPDLIICDVLLPRKDGFEVCKTLQNLSTTSTIPFIFLTAKVQLEDMREGMLFGADDYITKPFHIEDLLKSVQLRLEKHNRLLQKNAVSIDNVLNNPSAGMFMIRENQIVSPNAKICEISGYDVQELQNMSFTQIVDREISGNSFEKVHRWLNSLYSSVSLELTIVTKRNVFKPVDFYGTKINYQGREVHLAIVFEGKKSHRVIQEEQALHLTQREVEVLQLICLGYTSSKIAEMIIPGKCCQ